MKTKNDLKYAYINKTKFIIMLLGFSLITVFAGCTVIGTVIGSIVDKKNKKEIQISGWEITKIPKTKPLTFFLKNGDSIADKYLGIMTLPEDEYKNIYLKNYSDLNQFSQLPIFGDTIELALSDSKKSRIRLPFSGFNYNSVLVKKGNGDLKWYQYKNIVSVKLIDGRLMDINQIQNLVKTGELKSRSFIQTKSKIQINPADIQYISYYKYGSNGALTGILVGAGIDAGILAIIFSNFSLDFGSKNYNSNNSGSCPNIYSYDGNNYWLDSETFGGAIFKAAQRTDIDNLDYLKEHKGYYKLRLTNELDETQYVDEFKLLVADHPAGTQVMPSFDGKLHVLHTLQSPTAGMDKDGNNILHLVKSKDDKVWISNPFSRNADTPGDGRDAMEVTFDKPLHAETVKLAFNVKNTLWAASLQRDMLALHGNKLQDWYQLMDTSEPARTAFTKAMIREGMLLVQIWDGTNWQTKDYVWEVGPALPKDQVVVLDLKDISGDKLKIRLESTVGFWMINSIAADFSEDTTADFHELTAESAIDQTGKNVTEILRNNDGQYLVMPTTKDKVDITFKSLPSKKNFTRTYLLKCSGYYHIHTAETGEPKLSILNTLIAEPGAYGQFVLRKLNKELNLSAIQ
jgi:hypothetical protein